MNPSEIQGDLLQNPPAAGTPSATEELQAQFQSLRSLMTAALVALIFLNFGVLFFILIFQRDARARLGATRAEVRTLTAGFKANSEPLMRNFVVNLQAFSATNRDFQPVLDKYRSALFPYFTPVTSAAPAVPAAAAPAPRGASK